MIDKGNEQLKLEMVPKLEESLMSAIVAQPSLLKGIKANKMQDLFLTK